MRRILVCIGELQQLLNILFTIITREIARIKYRCDFLEYGERARHHTLL
jgi:hypothetical protein